ncbi:MAG: hypothetical protein Q4A58_03920 [Fusobacterium sp.]|uniref:hypothetical protein n=1 Tax=Fusobacterium sp. TaxID=68766 RepID=UPI0026DBE13F|nr:hypothetical protein [Fusobacterium sp.]MDO4690425.1 hypothetical protein [Fusobacterium sp.]
MSAQQKFILLILIARCFDLKEKLGYASEKALKFHQELQKKEAQIAFYKGFYDGIMKNKLFNNLF